MKYLIWIFIVLISFGTGDLFENNRMAAQIDTTSVVLMSGTVIANSAQRLTLNQEYLDLINSGRLEELSEKIRFSSMVLKDIKLNAESICKDSPCTPEQEKYITYFEEKFASKDDD